MNECEQTHMTGGKKIEVADEMSYGKAHAVD